MTRIGYTLTIKATALTKGVAVAIVSNLLAEIITAPDRAGYLFMNDRGSGEAKFEDVNDSHKQKVKP